MIKIKSPTKFKEYVKKAVNGEENNPFAKPATTGVRGLVVKYIEDIFKFSGYDLEPDVLRRQFFGWLYTPYHLPLKEIHISELSDAQVRVLFSMMEIWKDDDGNWHTGNNFDIFKTEISVALIHSVYYFNLDGVYRAKNMIMKFGDLIAKHKIGDEDIEYIEIEENGTVLDCLNYLGAIKHKRIDQELENYYQNHLIEKQPEKELIKDDIIQIDDNRIYNVGLIRL